MNMFLTCNKASKQLHALRRVSNFMQHNLGIVPEFGCFVGISVNNKIKKYMKGLFA